MNSDERSIRDLIENGCGYDVIDYHIREYLRWIPRQASIILRGALFKQLVESEPNISGLSAIRVPSTGIVSFVQICQKLGNQIEADGGKILYGSRVNSLSES